MASLITTPPKKRTVPMEVLALGMSRSGTESIRRALEQLGYDRTYHGIRDLMQSQDGYLWAELVDMKYGPNPRHITRSDLDRILGDCMAVTDMPCCAFWSELMDAYPEAKILLVERDLDIWYRSLENVLVKEVFSWRKEVLLWGIRWGLLPKNPNMFIMDLWWKYFRARNVQEFAANAKTIYREHYDNITKKAEAQGKGVLRMRIEEGWKPICDFLGKEMPEGVVDNRLPKGNEWQVTVAQTRGYQFRALYALGIAVLRRVAVAGGILGAVYLGVRWADLRR